MPLVVADITPAKISTGLKAMGKDKAPGPSFFTFPHIQKANINKIFADLFNNLLNKFQVPLK
jgi:hypothetical protein